MPRRALLALVLALLMLASGCDAPARPTVEELRKEYPLYVQNPLVDGTWASVENVVSEADSGVLATITDHAIIQLKNKRADGGKAVPSLQANSKLYEHYTLLIDTVLFGESPGSEISLYLPYSTLAIQPAQDIDQSIGKRFFYNLVRYAPEQRQQLDTLLDCNGIRERFPIYHGGGMIYWTREGCMLSARPLKGCDTFDLMTKAEFIKTIRELKEKAKDKP